MDDDEGAIDRASRELDSIAQAARDGIGAALALNELATSELDAVRRAAGSVQARMYGVLEPPPPCDDLVNLPLFRLGRWLDGKAEATRKSVGAQARGRIARLPRLWCRLTLLWTWLGLALTVGIAAAIMTGLWWQATLLLVVRVTISVAVGAEPNLPYEGYTSDGNVAAVIYRCIAGHVSDTLPLLAIAWSLADQQHAMLAFMAVVSLMTMLTATLLRVASLQVGVQMIRLTLERVARTGTVFLGLLLSVVFSSVGFTHGSLWICLAVAGPLAYALGEVWRSVVRLADAGKKSGGRLPDIRLVVIGDAASRTLPYLVHREPETSSVGLRTMTG